MKTSFVKSTGSFVWILLVTASMVTFSACNDDDDNATPQLNATDQQFMQTAKLGNNAEIQTSRLALTRSQDSAVRNFAQMMITHHTAANVSLDSLARLRSVTLPDSTQLDTMARSMVTRLTALQDSTVTEGTATDSTQSAFSSAYMVGQIQSHTKSQTDYQSYINNTQAQDAGVKNYATKTLPIVQSHLQMAQTIATQREYNTSR